MHVMFILSKVKRAAVSAESTDLHYKEVFLEENLKQKEKIKSL